MMQANDNYFLMLAQNENFPSIEYPSFFYPYVTNALAAPKFAV